MKKLAYLMVFALITTTLNLNAARKITSEPQSWEKREHYYKSKDSFRTFDIVYKGKFVIAEDDKDIISISPNGYLKISKTSFGNRRSLEILSDNEGNITKNYYEGKNKFNFDPAGKKWFEEILLEVVRKTGIGAEERVSRLYKKNGIDAFINELEGVSEYSFSSSTIVMFIYYEKFQIHGVNVRNLYLKILLDNHQLKKEELVPIIRVVENVGSNSTKGTLLRRIIENYQLDEYLMEKVLEACATLDYNTERGNTLRAFQKKYKINRDNYKEYFDVIKGISINSEKGNVLKPLLKSQTLDAKVFEELLETVEEFSSNSEKAAVLRKAVKYLPDDTKVNYAFKSAINSLSSSYHLLKDELLMMLAAEIKTTFKNNEAIMSIFERALEQDANTRKTTALRKVHASLSSDQLVIEKYFDVVKSMDNNMERYNVLLDMLDVYQLDKHGLLILLDVTEEIADDDYEHAATAILRNLVGFTTNDNKYFDLINKDEEVRVAFFEALEEIDHNSGKEELIRMFCEKKNLEDKTIIELLKTAEDIDVDIETSTSLLRIKEIMPKQNSEIKYIYKSVASDMNSDYEYERAMQGID